MATHAHLAPQSSTQRTTSPPRSSTGAAQGIRHRWGVRLDATAALVYDDPPAWRGLLVRSMRGERRAYRQLLGEFGDFLELYFSRQFPDHVAMVLLSDTLEAVHRKLGTCDSKRAVMPWLLAIADYRIRRFQDRPLLH